MPQQFKVSLSVRQSFFCADVNKRKQYQYPLRVCPLLSFPFFSFESISLFSPHSHPHHSLSHLPPSLPFFFSLRTHSSPLLSSLLSSFSNLQQHIYFTMISAVRSSKQVARAARPLAALSKTTLFSVPAVQARRHLTINAAAASAVATQRLRYIRSSQDHLFPGYFFDDNTLDQACVFAVALPRKRTARAFLFEYLWRNALKATTRIMGTTKNKNKND
ncbi:hypothetical protein BKA57DRAFT_216627 [Linnemannia elongata]|nr:hypothetical protein BKA57DRAFT_216627 [Linnemannia elongata]